MINREDNPEFLNSFLDYSITILNKSPNSVKEYNYDLAMFLKYMKIHLKLIVPMITIWKQYYLIIQLVNQSK